METSLSALATVIAIALVAFLWQLVYRRRGRDWAYDFLSVGVMAGFLAAGLLALIIAPDFNTGVALVWDYAPHAYNLIIWPLFCLVVLRPRFGAKLFLLSFVFLYGVDEILWNSLAVIKFGFDSPLLGYLLTQYWQLFFSLVVASVVLCYLVVKPRILANRSWGFFLAYVVVYVYVAGMPTYLDEPASLYAYAFAWELSWQIAVLMLAYWTLWPRISESISTPTGRN